MSLVPLDPDETDAEDDARAQVPLTGIDVSGNDREQILEALRLNRKLLHEPQPGADVDERAVRATIDALLDKLNEGQ